MKVAVTGATGFIGRHVVTELERAGYSPTMLVRPGSSRGAAIDPARVVEVDVANPPVDLFARIGTPDVLIHLAWAGLPRYGSLHHFESELGFQYRFLRGLVDEGLQSLIVAGTCFEYGMQSGCLHEDMFAQPVTPYGFAKDALRRQLDYLRSEKSFRLTWARLFYMYGEGQSDSSLYVQLKRAALAGERRFNMSGGEQLRDFLPVTEAANLLMQLALLDRDVGIVNVCSGKPRSVRSLVEDWMEANHWDIELNRGYYPYPKHEPLAFWGDRRRLDALLGK